MKYRLVALTLTVCLLLSGCGGEFTVAGGKDVETLLLVRTVGVDTRGDSTALTVCSGVGLDGSPPIVLREEGESISHVLGSLRYNAAGREPFFTHTQHVILGEETVRGAFPVTVDWILRSMEIRLDTDLYVLREGEAEELISGSMGKSTAVSDELTLMKEGPSAGKIYSCGETASRLREQGCALVCALKIQNTDDSSDGVGEIMPVPAGYAVVTEKGLMGYTDPSDSFALSLLENRVEGRILSAGEGASLTILDGERRFFPRFDGEGRLVSLEIELHVRCSLTETGEPSAVSDPDYRRRLEQDAEERIKGETEELIRLSQTMGVDFLDLEGKCRRAAPGKLQRMSARWEDVLPTLPIRTEVRAELVRTYNLERQ